MFGQTIDYYLLKPFTHKRNYATREELAARAKFSSFTMQDAQGYLTKIQSYFDGKIPVDPNLSYLDISCGMGRLIFGLSAAGSHDVTGVDIIKRDRLRYTKRRTRFLSGDVQNYLSAHNAAQLYLRV